jgi:signal transduction histidine kinase/CheY-like chemotaxis protein
MSHEMPRTPSRPKKKLSAKVVPIRPRRGGSTFRANKISEPVSPSALSQAITEMARSIHGSENGAEALKAQLSVVQELLKAKACFIATTISTESGLQIAYVRGRNDSRIMAPKVGHGALGRAFARGRIEREDGVVAAPLRGNHGLLGCLAVLDARLEPTDEVMEVLAAQTSAAMEVARFKDDTIRRAKDFQTAIAGLKSLEKHREEMLANVSHDLKNPLTSVKAYLAMLGRQKMGPLTDAQQRAIQVCDRNADRLLRMINDLLLLSRLQTGKMQLSDRPFGIKAVAEEVISSLSALSEHAQIHLKIAPSAEVFIRGDKDRFAEALYNLLDASISRSKPSETVSLTISTADPGIGVVTVSDQGRYLSSEELEHVFDGYHHSRRMQGTRLGSSGLALPLVAKIVQLHGGRVQVTSSEKEGTKFQLYVPMFAGPVAKSTVRQAPHAGGILVVEDDADVRDVLQKLLEEEDYRVATASSADEAIASLKQSAPAMVLLDLRLAGSDGRTVLHHIRSTKTLSQIPVYVISGASDVGQLTMGQGTDRIDGYFEKPVQLGKLLDTVAAVVRPSGHTSIAT